MRIVDRIKAFWKPKKENYVIKCPKCGSTDIGYYNGLSNFVQVVRDNAEPEYIQSAKCNNCGFHTSGEPNADNDDYLNEFVKEKKINE